MLKEERIWAVGTMSGTSLDGVDAALLLTDGHEILEFGESAWRPYSGEERAVIRAALGRWPGEEGVAAAAEVVETAHAELLAGLLAGPGGAAAGLIGFHGQTLAHDPAGGRTHQAGDGRVLAEVLGRPVVWDFRSTDIEMGGQGAPLAPFFHFACARWLVARGQADAAAPLAFLNLGGVGNLSWIDPRKGAPEEEGALLAFDTGPANAPINDLLQARLGREMDEGGALAAAGAVDAGVLEGFLGHPHFYKLPPKSLDRDGFGDLPGLVGGLADADAAATLTAMAAAAVVKGMEHCPAPPARVLVTGGGRKNPVLMEMLAAGLDCPVEAVEAAGLDGDMLEAQAFAYLAVRVMKGLATTAPGTTGVAAPVGGGRVSRPGMLAALAGEG